MTETSQPPDAHTFVELTPEECLTHLVVDYHTSASKSTTLTHATRTGWTVLIQGTPADVFIPSMTGARRFDEASFPTGSLNAPQAVRRSKCWTLASDPG